MIDNPEYLHRTVDPATMHAYSTHKNIPWNIVEYKPVREYLDPGNQIQERKYASQKKGQKNTSYITKRGFYMDYDLKIAKAVPSPLVHAEVKNWANEKEKTKGANKKIDLKAIKHTYLETIEAEQKIHKVPGVSAYSLEKSFKQITADVDKLKKRKVSVGQKPFFYNDTLYLSNRGPGAGEHCPHLPNTKMRLNKTDHKFWTLKHHKEDQSFLKRESTRPAAGTYNPVNVTISTFDDLSRLSKSPKKDDKKSYFGSDARFEYTRTVKAKIIEQRPSPSSYATTLEWKGKQVSPKKVSWTERIWKGESIHNTSVYH